jgi:hypothetical protein
MKKKIIVFLENPVLCRGSNPCPKVTASMKKKIIVFLENPVFVSGFKSLHKITHPTSVYAVKIIEYVILTTTYDDCRML